MFNLSSISIPETTVQYNTPIRHTVRHAVHYTVQQNMMFLPVRTL
jgi:hypothetical protein